MTSGHAGVESKEPATRLPAVVNLSQNVSWLGQKLTYAPKQQRRIQHL